MFRTHSAVFVFKLNQLQMNINIRSNHVLLMRFQNLSNRSFQLSVFTVFPLRLAQRVFFSLCTLPSVIARVTSSYQRAQGDKDSWSRSILHYYDSTVHPRLSEQVKLKFLLGRSDTEKNSDNR